MEEEAGNTDDNRINMQGKVVMPHPVVSDGGELPPEFVSQWHRLSQDGQKTFQDYLQHMSICDVGTVEVNSNDNRSLNFKLKNEGPFVSLPSEVVNTVRTVNKDKRDEQLEAVLQGIQFIHDRKLPRGLVLKQGYNVQSPITTQQVVDGCEKMAKVLGKGNSAGEITVLKDRKSGHEMALKTVMISQFNANEIRLWVHLGDLNLAPELYHFELVNNKLVFTMEIMTGKDLQDVIDDDMWNFSDTALARNFSLCILHDILQIWEEMRSKNFIHGDLHGGNLRLEKSMKIKIFDFGRASDLLKAEKSQIRNDIIGIIRVFCALYSGFDFNDIFEAVKILEAKDLKQLDDCMIRISEENRKEMYHIMNLLFDTVRKDSNSYGNAAAVTSYVKRLLPEDMTEIKKRAAVIIFPERFQGKAESEPVSKVEKDMVDTKLKGYQFDPIWDDPNMEEFVSNVSDVDLRELEAL